MANENREKAKLHLDHPYEFGNPDLLYQSFYTDSLMMANQVGNVFKQIFCDVYGARIDMGNNHQPVCMLFFMDKSQDAEGLKAIQPALTRDSSAEAKLDQINSIARSSGAKRFQLTADGKDILEDFVPNNAIVRSRNNSTTIKWGEITPEFSCRSDFDNRPIPLMGVIVDLNKILRFMYGTKEKPADESRPEIYYQYTVCVGNPINAASAGNGALVSNCWQLLVVRLNMNQVNSISRSYGYQCGNNLGIVRC